MLTGSSRPPSFSVPAWVSDAMRRCSPYPGPCAIFDIAGHDPLSLSLAPVAPLASDTLAQFVSPLISGICRSLDTNRAIFRVAPPIQRGGAARNIEALLSWWGDTPGAGALVEGRISPVLSSDAMGLGRTRPDPPSWVQPRPDHDRDGMELFSLFAHEALESMRTCTQRSRGRTDHLYTHVVESVALRSYIRFTSGAIRRNWMVPTLANLLYRIQLGWPIDRRMWFVPYGATDTPTHMLGGWETPTEHRMFDVGFDLRTDRFVPVDPGMVAWFRAHPHSTRTWGGAWDAARKAFRMGLSLDET